jgi:hypothetical protein
MASIDFRPDRHGLKQLLQSLDGPVNSLADQVASNLKSQGRTVAHGDTMPVVVDLYTTNRAAASVTIAHPAGLAVQAKHGALTAAAAAAGLEVRSK